MSIRIMSMVWDNGPSDKADILILLALADFCNDAGECWPAVKSIAKKARMTERGAQKIISRLVDAGWVDIEPGGGRKNCNLYRIKNPEPRSPRTPFTPNTVTETPNTVPKNPEPGSPEPSYNHQEPSEIYTPAQLTLVAPPQKPPDLFSEFWDRYPKRVGKADAHKAYTKALKKITHDDLMFALSERLPALEAKEKQYRPNPATWLNQERWTDDIDANNDTGRSGTGRSGNAMVDAFAAVAAERSARDRRG